MLRPGLQQFVEFLLKGFWVGIWSSMPERTLIPILQLVARNIHIGLEQFLFIYDRRWCSEDPRIAHPYEPNHGLFVKPFTSIDVEFDRDNVILIDETREKAEYNPPGSFIEADGFEGDPDDRFFERLQPYLWNLYWFSGCAADYVWENTLR